jgi:CubicO group peptidase (beta-lactamase class C family)
MQTQVLKPLGIVGGYTPETLGQDEANNLAVLYRKGTEELWNTSGPWVPQVDDYRGKLPPPRSGLNAYVPGTNATGFGPQGGLRISVAGLAKIMQMLMNAGVVGDVRILRPESVRAMAQAQWQHRSGQNNGDTLNGIFHSWGLGMQRFEDISGPATGDRLVAKGGITGVGHLGEAYGLNSGFIYDPVSRNGVIFAIGGTGTDPEKDKGQYSSFQSWEEGILDVLFGVAMQVHQPGAN